MHRSHTRMRSSGWTAGPFNMRRDQPEPATNSLVEVFKHLFLPFRDYPEFDSGCGDRVSTYNSYYLKRLTYSKDQGRTRLDLTTANLPGTHFAAALNTGEGSLGFAPYLGIRLDQRHSSSRMQYRNGRSELVAETRIPLYDVKAITVKRLTEGDFARLEDSGYLSSDPPEDYMYEVSIQFFRYGNTPFSFNSTARQFITGPYYRQYETAARQLKDLHKSAESVKFVVTAPCESWTQLRRLQRDLGIRDEPGNSSNTIFVALEHVQDGGRLGMRASEGLGWRGGSRYGREHSPLSVYDDVEWPRQSVFTTSRNRRYGGSVYLRDYDYY
ncbi:hypothetical protein ABW20_dc0106090 [Dactylellina cionopaga]|nr:hypothetical protein ABW20_dc0106090 [Dactylellina cionopaga]